MKQLLLFILFGFLMVSYGKDSASTGAGVIHADTAAATKPKPDWNPPEALIHPGGLNTQERLNIARQRVAEGIEPWKAAWDALERTDAKKDYQPEVTSHVIDQSALQRQGHAAYVLAIKWAISGDIEYAEAAIRILDAWTDTVETLDFSNFTLRVGIGSIQMANAAEILATAFNGSAGWPEKDAAKARIWFKEVINPILTTGNMRSSNWGTSALGGAMSVAIFLDDLELFNTAVYAYKYGFPDENDPTNRHKDGCCHVTDYVWHPCGQCNESGRDQAHPMGGVGHLVETAMMAWNQGVDIVSFPYDDPIDYRVVAGMEYLARYNLGYEVPWYFGMPDICDVNPTHPHEDGVATKCRYEIAPVWEICKRLFTDVGASHPYTQEMLLSSGDQFTYYPSRKKGGSYRPETTTSDNPGMGTLLYYDPTDPQEAEPDSESFLGGVIASINSKSIQSALGAPEREGIYFKSVPKNSSAARMGFKNKDAILAVNGTVITSKDSFKSVYTAIKPGSMVKVTLLRNQSEKSFAFKKKR